jgi:hypothetical protein
VQDKGFLSVICEVGLGVAMVLARRLLSKHICRLLNEKFRPLVNVDNILLLHHTMAFFSSCSSEYGGGEWHASSSKERVARAKMFLV